MLVQMTAQQRDIFANRRFERWGRRDDGGGLGHRLQRFARTKKAAAHQIRQQCRERQRAPRAMYRVDGWEIRMQDDGQQVLGEHRACCHKTFALPTAPWADTAERRCGVAVGAILGLQ